MSTREESREQGEGVRHLLVAVDGSQNAEKAVLYVADFLGGIPRFRITLFHVVVLPQEDLFKSGDERLAWVREKETEAADLLDRYRRILIDAGFDEARVATRICTSEEGRLARLIIEEHVRLGACTVILGRSGKSRQEEFIFGSISSRLVREATNCSVWVVN